MKELLEFIVGNILGKTAKFEITEDDEGGMVIGKGGKVIKAIRNVLRIKATLEKKKIILLVNPSSN